MISKDCFTANWIDQKSKEPQYSDKIIAERQICKNSANRLLPAFRWICNPPEFNISICNAIIGLKLTSASRVDLWFRPNITLKKHSLNYTDFVKYQKSERQLPFMQSFYI